MSAHGQINRFKYQGPINARPYDVEITPNGALAVVRSNSSQLPTFVDHNRITFWKTNANDAASARLPLIGGEGRGHVPVTGVNLANFSDAVACTNNAAVSIGSADINADGIEDTTYVDIFSLDTVNLTHQMLNFAELGGSATATNPNARAGLAHDVAITPDGSKAVVVSQNWIHVFTLVGVSLPAIPQVLNPGDLEAAFNVGAPAAGNSAPVAPLGARNTLALTNSRAVVTQRRFSFATSGGVFYYHTWVYIVDLSVDPPVLVFAADADPNGDGQTDQDPHDLAISPNGNLALVTTRTSEVLLNLTSNTRIGFNQLNSCSRTFDSFYDSVELSDDRAVVIDNHLNSSANPDYCEMHVLSVSATGMTTLRSYAAALGSLGWDVDMSTDGHVAGVKTGQQDIVLYNLDNPGASDIFTAGTASGNNSQHSGGWTSDMNAAVAVPRGYVEAVQQGGNEDGVHRWVAFLGRPTSTTSRVKLYDLGVVPNPPNAPVQEFKFDVPSPAGETALAVDLELAYSRSQVILRNSTAIDELDPQAGGQDWYRFRTEPPALVGSGIGGLKGPCEGADNLREARGVSVSISRDLVATGQGYIHVVQTTN